LICEKSKTKQYKQPTTFKFPENNKLYNVGFKF